MGRLIADNAGVFCDYNAVVHWLTWREIESLFQTWQGFTASIIAICAAVYYGPRKMLETWDWYFDRVFHSKVRLYLYYKVTKVFNTMHGDVVYGVAQSVQEIAKGTKLSEKRVRKSLAVLKHKKEAIEDGESWRTPHRPAV